MDRQTDDTMMPIADQCFVYQYDRLKTEQGGTAKRKQDVDFRNRAIFFKSGEI